jgi:hypothetical protein
MKVDRREIVVEVVKWMLNVRFFFGGGRKGGSKYEYLSTYDAAKLN